MRIITHRVRALLESKPRPAIPELRLWETQDTSIEEARSAHFVGIGLALDTSIPVALGRLRTRGRSETVLEVKVMKLRLTFGPKSLILTLLN